MTADTGAWCEIQAGGLLASLGLMVGVRGSSTDSPDALVALALGLT